MRMPADPPPRIEPGDGALVDVGDVRVWCHDTGEEDLPTLVMLGGFTAGHHAHDAIREHLSGYRLITWEPRGLGPSDCPDPSGSEYSVDVWTADLDRLLSALGVPRAHLWAIGFGSYYALQFAALHPQRVGALVTYTDVWAGDETKGYRQIWNVYRAIVENFGTTGFGARVLAGIFDVSGLEWFVDWESTNIEEVLHLDTVGPTVGYCCTEADVREHLESIEAPTLVVQGDLGWDGSKVEADADRSLALMRERMPRLELAVVPDTHPAYVAVQRPRACAEPVLEFLDQHPLEG